MKEQPELKAQIDRFRQENFELQNSAQADELLTGRMNFRGVWRSSAKIRWWTNS